MNRTDTFDSTPKETVLEEAQRLIFGDRRQDYGHPLDDYTRTAGMVNAAFADLLKRPFTAEEIMMIMIMVKISRYRVVPKRDSLVDGAGYFGCIAEAIEERKRRLQATAEKIHPHRHELEDAARNLDPALRQIEL